MLRFIRALVALSLLLTLPSSPAFAAPVPAKPAAAFFDSLCLNTHPSWLSTPTWATPAYSGFVNDIGVKTTRGLLGRNKTALANMKPFFDAGGKHITTVVQSWGTGGKLDRTAAAANIDFAISQGIVGSVYGFEGANEFNIDHTAGWATELRGFTQWMSGYVRSKPALAGTKLVGPSIYKRILADYQALGNIDAYVDRGALHYYSGNQRPTRTGSGDKTIAGAFRDAHILTPDPILVTETGYQIPGVSERVQAIYNNRLVFDLFEQGAERSCIYELADDSKLFGLMTADLKRKRPAYYALKNLTALFKDSGTATGSLDYTLSGAPADMKRHLFRTSGGNYLLVLYRDVDSFRSGHDVTYAPVNVTVTFGSAVSRLEIFEPTFDANAKKSVVSASSIAVPVADQVEVLRVTP